MTTAAAKRKVYLFQPGVSHGKGRFLGYYLPHSVGSVWSYARSRAHIRDGYELGEVIFRREPPGEVLARLDNPRVACFSAYVWNWRWNLFVAAAIKQRFPECLVVFGGPQVPERDDHALFSTHPFIDVAVHGEGEEAFLEILERALAGRGLAGILGTSIPGPDRLTIAHPRRPRLELERRDLPSPLLDGSFDALLAAHPGVRWHAVVETHRGCPFSCSFCDWGSLIYAKVKRFDLDRVLREIDWLGRNAIDYVFVADANFGVFRGRDEAIVDQFIATRETLGHPRAVAATWDKNSSERTLELARRLDAAGLSRGITLSVQSMNPATLAAIHRQNLKFSRLGQMFELAERAGVPAVTEMILGLPEETYESWADGICQILELGNHSALTFYPAELLENAELNTPAVRERYGIRSARLASWAWEPDTLDVDGIEELSEVVTSTRTLPPDEYLDALMFAWLILNFHVEGWTQLLARGARRYAGLSYRRFYEALRRWILRHPESLLGEEHATMRRSWSEYFATGRQQVAAYRFGSLQVQGYMQIHATQYALRCHHGRAWADVEQFWGDLAGGADIADIADGGDVADRGGVAGRDERGDVRHGLPADLAADLLALQSLWVTRFGGPFRQSHVARFNLWEYLLGAEPLRAEETVYDLEVTEPYDRESIDDFLNKVYFRRRAGFGKLRVRRGSRSAARAAG